MAIVLACARGERTRSDTPAASPTAAGGQTAAAPVVAQAGAVPDVPPDVRAVCDTVAASWQAFRQARLTRADSVTSRRPTDDEWDDKGARATLPVSACFVDAMADTALDSASRARTYWQAVHWAEILRSRADGPDGTSWLAQRGTIRCEIAILVDGGDDSDSTYVPSPFERETTMCYRAPRALSAHDTTYDLPP